MDAKYRRLLEDRASTRWWKNWAPALARGLLGPDRSRKSTAVLIWDILPSPGRLRHGALRLRATRPWPPDDVLSPTALAELFVQPLGRRAPWSTTAIGWLSRPASTSPAFHPGARPPEGGTKVAMS